MHTQFGKGIQQVDRGVDFPSGLGQGFAVFLREQAPDPLAEPA